MEEAFVYCCGGKGIVLACLFLSPLLYLGCVCGWRSLERHGRAWGPRRDTHSLTLQPSCGRKVGGGVDEVLSKPFLPSHTPIAPPLHPPPTTTTTQASPPLKAEHDAAPPRPARGPLFLGAALLVALPTPPPSGSPTIDPCPPPLPFHPSHPSTPLTHHNHTLPQARHHHRRRHRHAQHARTSPRPRAGRGAGRASTQPHHHHHAPTHPPHTTQQPHPTIKPKQPWSSLVTTRAPAAAAAARAGGTARRSVGKPTSSTSRYGFYPPSTYPCRPSTPTTLPTPPHSTRRSMGAAARRRRRRRRAAAALTPSRLSGRRRRTPDRTRRVTRRRGWPVM